MCTITGGEMLIANLSALKGSNYTLFDFHVLAVKHRSVSSLSAHDRLCLPVEAWLIGCNLQPMGI
jgi:hypothetical protein